MYSGRRRLEFRFCVGVDGLGCGSAGCFGLYLYRSLGMLIVRLLVIPEERDQRYIAVHCCMHIFEYLVAHRYALLHIRRVVPRDSFD